MRIFIAVICVLTLSACVTTQAPWNHGVLRVSENGRFLQHANGKPFFWLGDINWLIAQKLDRDEVKMYFENRRGKGFNVVQTILKFSDDVNVYGDSAFVGRDLSRFLITPGNSPDNPEEYDYWDHVDFAIDVAAQNGIYLAIVPVWGQYVRRNAISEEAAEVFATTLAERFRSKPNIIWLNGGGIQGDMKPEFWNTVGATIKKHDPAHLMSFHTFGRTQTSTWFHNASWLDINMFTSGHRRYDQDDTPKKYGEDSWRYVLDDHSKLPLKPTIDGEPSFEATPQGLHDVTQPYWTSADARRYTYWSVFAGACGHSYGHNSVRQVYKQGEKPASGAKTFFHEALDDTGAYHMQHIKNLVLSRPFFDRINDQSIVTGDEGEKYDRILVTRGNDFLMAYTYTGRSFTIQMGKISGSEVHASWYNPRTGVATKVGSFDNRGFMAFDPPGEKNNGNDWVLVLDDASKKFTTPGVPIAY